MSLGLDFGGKCLCSSESGVTGGLMVKLRLLIQNYEFKSHHQEDTFLCSALPKKVATKVNKVGEGGSGYSFQFIVIHNTGEKGIDGSGEKGIRESDTCTNMPQFSTEQFAKFTTRLMPARLNSIVQNPFCLTQYHIYLLAQTMKDCFLPKSQKIHHFLV